MHITVHELLTGERGPMSLYEFGMWSTYYKVKQYYADTKKK